MTTRADLYRALAADGLTIPQIAKQTGGMPEAIRDALKRKSGRRGRPRTRCAVCVCAVCGGTWEATRVRERADTTR